MRHVAKAESLLTLTVLLALALPLPPALAAAVPALTVNTDGVWGVSDKGTDGEGANCDRWATGPRGNATVISDTDPAIQNQGTNRDDENQIRYGAADVNDDPPPCLEFAEQSGFGFIGVRGINMNTIGTSFKLGTLTHYNTTTNIDLADYNPLGTVGLTINVSGDVDAVLEYTITLDETANDDDPCKFPDAPNDPPCGERVTIAAQTAETPTVPVAGKQYAVELLGFADCETPETPTDVFYTHEGAADMFCLYARLVAAGESPRPILASEKPTYAPGDDILVTFTGGPGNKGDWIGLYAEGKGPEGGDNDPHLKGWYYTNGAQSTGTRAPREGRVVLDGGSENSENPEVDWPLADGAYDLYFICCDGYDVLAGPVGIEIDPQKDAGPRLAVDKSTYASGENIVVTYTGGPGNKYDWVAVYDDGVIPSSGIFARLWYYTDGTQDTGTPGAHDASVVMDSASENPENWEVDWPLADGDYDVYLLCCDDYVPPGAQLPSHYGVLAGPLNITIGSGGDD
jgi:hypothetical protein